MDFPIFLLWRRFVSPSVGNVIKLTEFPNALGYPKLPGTNWTTVFIRTRLRLCQSADLKETKDGCKKSDCPHLCYGNTRRALY